MFLRKLIKQNGRTYYYVLKSVFDKKKGYCVHERIADLSKLPFEIIMGVKAMLSGERFLISPKNNIEKIIKIISSRYFGPLWVFLHFWFELNLSGLFTRAEYKNLTALVLARTTEPKKCRSELKTFEWLRKTSLHLIFGGSEKQWQRKNFYPLLTKLTDTWGTIETALWEERKSVPRLYLYDITSTYFEGCGGSFGALGYSRDEKRHNPQVVIALVSDEKGIPIALRILPGNTKDSTTVEDSINELKAKYQAEKTVIIMDRGMQGGTDIDTITGRDLDFIIALKHKKAREFLLNHHADLEWDLFDKRNIAEWYEGTKRYIVCHNPEVAKKDHNVRNKILERAEKRLDSLVNMAKKGRIKNKNKILTRTVKILTQTKSEKYFEYDVGEGHFKYKRTKHVSWDEMYEGCYILETSLDDNVAKEEIDSSYRTQREVEEVFKSCKSELNLRPNFHKKDANIFGHIYLTFLAHYIKRKIELRLKENGLDEKGSYFLDRFSDIVLSNVDINGERDQVVTELDNNQNSLLKMLKISMPSGAISGSLGKYIPKYLQHLRS